MIALEILESPQNQIMSDVRDYLYGSGDSVLKKTGLMTHF